MNEIYKKAILEKIKKTGAVPLPYKVLLRACKVPGGEFKVFTDTLEGLKNKGDIFEGNDGFVMPTTLGMVTAQVVKLNKTYGFVKNLEDQTDIFISGKFLKGAMPKDIVLVRTYSGRGQALEGEVVQIIEEQFSQFTGNIVLELGKFMIIPDAISKFAMSFENPQGFEINEGDKVLAEITVRGNRHSEHTCKIVASFGSSLKASVCALSVIELNCLSPIFPDAVVAEALKVSSIESIQAEAINRVDMRGEIIFTIDGADTKDIDDAISLKKFDDYYELGVHIADVSFYVTPKSALDNEALRRGTSVYYANRVIPMLPKELSNGICSLNPQEDRLAFSAIMKIDFDGKLMDYTFEKTIIRSRVKGVYAEINQILSGTQTPEITQKYTEVMDNIKLMSELAEILARCKKERGAPQLETVESKLIINAEDFCVDVKPRTRGKSEEIIEDFMLMANEAAAHLGRKNEIPFVYRIHENPGAEKIVTLETTLKILGLSVPDCEKIKPKHLSQIIEMVKGTELQMIVNNLVLRSMAKAKYSNEPIGHFGLVLEDYAHFTSPIRRYPDLSIHRIMSDFLTKTSKSELNRKYQKFVFQASQASTDAELVAMKVERDCEDCYKAEFMSSHVGEEFDGLITSVMEFGLFVGLPNTCEGLLHMEALPQGEYNYDGSIKLTNNSTGVSYRVGDKIRVKVQNANVSSGKVDFSLPSEAEAV